MDKLSFFKMLKSGEFASLVNETVAQYTHTIAGPKDVFNIIRPLVAKTEDIEQFWVIFLTNKNQVIKTELLSKGTIDLSPVYPRELIKRMIALNAKCIILSHNHPSFDPSPSNDDKAITKKVMAAVYSIGGIVHDHVIVSGKEYFSFADAGLLSGMQQRINQFFLNQH